MVENCLEIVFVCGLKLEVECLEGVVDFYLIWVFGVFVDRVFDFSKEFVLKGVRVLISFGVFGVFVDDLVLGSFVYVDEIIGLSGIEWKVY